jgi:hypothetical protein
MFKFGKTGLFQSAVACIFFAAPALAADQHVGPMKEFAEKTARAWITDPTIIEAVKDQNKKNADLSQADIDRLDKQWRAETKVSERPLIDDVLSRAISKSLLGTKNSASGLVTEVFVMDNKGLNVGQSDVTSDYWQGDEAKWQETYLAGADAVLIDDVEFDESTQTFQSQLSLPIVDPDTGDVIGAATFGIDVDALLR